MRRICVFCGSSMGNSPEYAAAAAALGTLLASRGIGLVYGGASVGTMGAVADAALAAGGEVIGVIPEALSSVEISHPGLTELHIVADMHERKAKMAALSDGFLALPGGAGTLEELFEIWTWAQLGLHTKPLGLVDVAGYYAPLRVFVDHMVTEGFLRPAHRDFIVVDPDPAVLLDAFATYEPPARPDWAKDS
ncbi:TIGR00730 family Rossman fold protein [Amycolatopsis sp. NPDC059657]|uniref:LOG family protein n=1 Tax=Amycolatopsis sp. NPDC059657 TaxID=3346899 RepID=UPI0036734F90